MVLAILGIVGSAAFFDSEMGVANSVIAPQPPPPINWKLHGLEVLQGDWYYFGVGPFGDTYCVSSHIVCRWLQSLFAPLVLLRVANMFLP